MHPESLNFVHEFLRAARNIVPAPLLPWATAMACYESGWGTTLEGNNPLGINPVGDQPHVTGKPWIREFDSWAAAVRAWLYLIAKSEHYDVPRARYNDRVYTISSQDQPAIDDATLDFMRDVAAIYCPRNPAYFAMLQTLHQLILPIIADFLAKQDTHKPCSP